MIEKMLRVAVDALRVPAVSVHSLSAPQKPRTELEEAQAAWDAARKELLEAEREEADALLAGAAVGLFGGASGVVAAKRALRDR